MKSRERVGPVGDGDTDRAAATDDGAFGPTHATTVPARQASA